MKKNKTYVSQSGMTLLGLVVAGVVMLTLAGVIVYITVDLGALDKSQAIQSDSEGKIRDAQGELDQIQSEETERPEPIELPDG